MHSTLIFASREGERVRRPRFHGTAVYFEVRSDVTKVARYSGGEVRMVELPDADPAGALLAFDNDELIYLTTDATLVAVAFDRGTRQPLRTLAPAPRAIAITPECVVWCSAWDGDHDGEVWRWWRDTDRVEELARHRSERPLLAIRPVPLPFPPERITTDIAIAADQRIGLIDVEGVDWIAEADDRILHLACTHDRIVAATRDWVVDVDLDREACERVFGLEGPPLALIANDDRTIVAHDCVLLTDLDGQVVCSPPANIYELTRGPVPSVRCAGPLVDPTWVRGSMELADGPIGAILVEHGSALDDIDRVTYLPADWRPVNAYESLELQRWLPDGRGMHVTIEGRDWWGAMMAGEISSQLFRDVNRWLAETTPFGGGVPTGWRGWRITMGDADWFCAYDDVYSGQADAIARLIALLGREIPPLALAARLRNVPPGS